MQTRIEGAAYVLGDNIDTDQIIPAQYLTYNPSIPAEYKMFGKFALCGVPDDQAGLPKGHVPFHAPGGDEFVSPYKIIDRREELRVRVEPRARADRAGRGGHRRGRRRVLRAHLLPQRGQRRIPDPARSEDAAHRPRLHRRQSGNRHDRRDADEHDQRRDVRAAPARRGRPDHRGRRRVPVREEGGNAEWVKATAQATSVAAPRRLRHISPPSASAAMPSTVAGSGTGTKLCSTTSFPPVRAPVPKSPV